MHIKVVHMFIDNVTPGLERWLSSVLTVLAVTGIWFLSLPSSGSQRLVNPSTRDLTPSSGLMGT